MDLRASYRRKVESKKIKRLPAFAIVSSLALATLLAGCRNCGPTQCADRPSCCAPASAPMTAPAMTARAMTAPAVTNVTLPSSLDVNNPAEIASALKAFDIETPTYDPIGTDRAGGAEGDVFPTWPAGEVRKAGLSTFRIDARASYGDDGTLKFMKGSTVLHEASFKPKDQTTVNDIPAAVLDSLNVGDKVTWGVYFAGKSQKPAVVSFHVIEKAAVTKAVNRLEADTLATPILRDIAKARALQNYGMHAEAMQLYVGINEQDPRVVSVLNFTLECLRALKLKNTPLYDDVKVRAVGVGSPLRPGAESAAHSTPKTSRPGANPVSAPGARPSATPTPAPSATPPAPDSTASNAPKDPTTGLPTVPGQPTTQPTDPAHPNGPVRPNDPANPKHPHDPANPVHPASPPNPGQPGDAPHPISPPGTAPDPVSPPAAPPSERLPGQPPEVDPTPKPGDPAPLPPVDPTPQPGDPVPTPPVDPTPTPTDPAPTPPIDPTPKPGDTPPPPEPDPTPKPPK